MSVPERFKEVLRNEADKQPVKKPVEKVQIPDKFKKLLKHQDKLPSPANRTRERKKKGLPGPMRKYSDRKLLRILKAEAKKLGRTPTTVHFQNSKGLPSVIVYAKRWGSWNNAIRAAGLEPNFVVGRRKSRREKLPDAVSLTESSKSIPRFQKIELFATLSDQRAEGLRAVEELGTQLGLDIESLNEATALYRKALENNLHKGRTKESMTSATIYLASRKTKKPLTVNEIAQKAGLSSRLLMATARHLEKKMKLRITHLQPLELFDGVAKQLHLDNNVRASAKAILHSPIIKRYSMGKNPLSIVAAAIYLAGLTSGSSITQDEISRAAGITTVTIRNRYRTLAQKLGIDLTKFLSPNYIRLMRDPSGPQRP